MKPTQILIFSFALVILIGCLLLSLPIASRDGQSVGLLNALFTSTSAVCVTGLVVVDTYTQYNIFGQVIIMLLIQIGGLGTMTMATFTFLILGKKITLKERLVIQEALNQLTISGLIRLTQYIITITVIFEGIGAVLLSLRFSQIYGTKKGIYYGVFHSISAFNNAGFDLIGDFRNLTPFTEDPLVCMVIATLIIIGGIGFSVIYDVFSKRSLRKLSLHSKIVITMTIALILVGMFFFYVFEYSNPKTLEDLSLKDKLLASLFQSVTTRTAGFNTLNFSDMVLQTKYITIALMFIGASSGSTGGGIKTTTFASIIMLVHSAIGSKEDVEIFQRRIPDSTVFKAVAITVISILLIFISSMLLTITENQDFIDILFETVSAFGTVGLSLGITTELSELGKTIIILIMFAGRVGPLTLAMALSNRKNKTPIKYPEEKILIG